MGMRQGVRGVFTGWPLDNKQVRQGKWARRSAAEASPTSMEVGMSIAGPLPPSSRRPLSIVFRMRRMSACGRRGVRLETCGLTCATQRRRCS